MPRVTDAVRADRLETDLTTLATFTAPGEGVTRPAWSKQYYQARDWVAERAGEAGLEAWVDPIGNLWATWLPENQERTDSLVVGSHIDTVPNAGRLDGCLGVLGGLEAIRALREVGFQPSRPIRLVAWIEEEGTATGRTLLGSSVFTGEVALAADPDRWPGHTGELARELARLINTDHKRAPSWSAHTIDDVGTYLELHIEQGPVLHRDGIEIGVVSGIVGCRGGTLRFHGTGNHAGTTPMDARHDALVAAAGAVTALRDLAVDLGVTVTTGRVMTRPNAANVIPASVELSYDVRSLDDELLDQYIALALAKAEALAHAEGVDFFVQEQARIEAVPLDASLQQLVAGTAGELGLSHTVIPSGALHDAAPLARRAATAMIFVPSVDGISHAPAESTSREQCAAGVAVLTELMRRLG